MNSHAELLRLLDADAEVLITGHQDRVADRTVPRERDHVGHDQGIDALLFADAVHESKADLHIIEMGQREMLRSRARRCPVIPVDAKKWRAGLPGRKCSERAHSGRMVQSELSPSEFPADQQAGPL